MASYNRVIMMGNLTRDPDCKQLASGQMVCRLGIASNRSFKNRQTGAMTQEVCFVDIDVWGPQAESCQQYLHKGRAVLVEGRLKLDTWQEQDGAKRSKHSIVADRVTFMPTSMQAEDGSAQHEEAMQDFAPAKAAAPKQTKKATPKLEGAPTGEIDFKDEQPFEDDLPF